MLWVKVGLVLFCWRFARAIDLDFRYHNNAELEGFLRNFTSLRRTGGPNTRLYSIGKSANLTDLLVVEVSAAPEGRPGVPHVKLIGGVHGNEPVGRELLLHFLKFLCDSYEGDAAVRWLLRNTRVHLLPNMNPDGFAIAGEGVCGGDHGRFNGPRGKDLNRNFPDFFHANPIPEEPETRAVKRWMDGTPFVLSAALHSGALVANYPFDNVKESTSLPTHPASLTPDDDVFKHLASTYAQNHLSMHKGIPCAKNERGFPGGITNGAAWYSFSGGMQDYNYAIKGCMEITLEISCCKYPSADSLAHFWRENKRALLQYLFQAHRGVRGQIVDGADLRPVRNATLQIQGRNISFHPSREGEFWRILLPGTYELKVVADGYYEKTVPFVVREAVDDDGQFAQSEFLKIRLMNTSCPTTTSPTTTTTAREANTTFFQPPSTKEMTITNRIADVENYEKLPKEGQLISCAVDNAISFFCNWLLLMLMLAAAI